jgi:hypothetical protein
MNAALKREFIVSSILAGLCLAFGVFVLVEWSQLENRLRERKSEIARPVESEVSFEKISEVDFELPVIDSYTDLVERPLFVEGRRPLEESADDALQQTDKYQGEKLRAKLMGIYSGSDGMTALILDAEGKYVRVKKQDSVNGWQVEALFPDRVTLKQGGETQELKLHKPKPKFSRKPRQRKPTLKSRAEAREKAKARARTRSDLKSTAGSKPGGSRKKTPAEEEENEEDQEDQ